MTLFCFLAPSSGLMPCFSCSLMLRAFFCLPFMLKQIGSFEKARNSLLISCKVATNTLEYKISLVVLSSILESNNYGDLKRGYCSLLNYDSSKSIPNVYNAKAPPPSQHNCCLLLSFIGNWMSQTKMHQTFGHITFNLLTVGVG